MNCAACGHDNLERAKFCLECGAPFAARCGSCGVELPPAAKFCLECGARVEGRTQGAAGAAQPAPARPGLAEGERTSRAVVSIIFADLVGSTALHERLDAEAVREFMERYYAAMRGAVEAHGGRVTQVMGDGVKAVFGAPRVAEDDAIRAVRAAVAMQEAFRALADEQRGRVGKTGLRVAVNTGEVVSDGESEIIGDPVNVAARLQEQGKDGDVVIGGATQRIVGALVTLELLGRFALKGRAEQVEAHRLVSLEPPAATKAAFVGRDEELARLAAVYETAIAKPAAQLAVLLGSPGLGKSRLIDEFARRLGEGATVLAAHCDASGGATFAPLAAALREHLGIEDGAKAEALRTVLEAALPGEDAERARIVVGVAALLAGTPASPEETFFVVRRLLAALATVKPVVLVIDDLHWAESLLLDLVEHLVQWGSGVPLFVLVGARPELRELRGGLVVPGGFVADVLTLSGLDAGAAMRLAAGVIGAADLPAALAAKLLATSEGNPLFVGELIKMLVQEGVLQRDGERWVASAALADLEMPPTIHALLAARIERLRPEERAVLERAAVVGRHFSKSAVAALLASPAGLEARLEALRRSELIERDTGWFLGEPVLRFHHVLIRDAAYRRVLKGTRAELHARLAGWIEAKVGDAAEHDETLGWHFEQAHQHLRELGPLDAHGLALGARATRRLSAAGRRALARDDVALAASLLGRAFACLPPEDEERPDLVLDWCEALLSAGEVGTAAAAIAELERTSAGSERLRAWHTCFAGQLATLTNPQGLGATADAVAAAAAALAGLGDAAGEAKAHFVHAQALARLGRVGACEAALDLALAAARRAGDRRRANAVLAGAPRAALWGPSPVTRASGRCLDVVRVLRITQGAPAVEAVALSCQGVLEALRGRTDAAKRMIASARKMVEELGIAQRLFEADVFAGRVALLEGDADAAEQSLRGAYEGLRDLGLGIDAAQTAALLARALLAQGRAAEAEALSHESEALAGDDLQAAIAWRGVRAEALAQRGEHAAAVEFARAAVEIASATDALLDHADARVALGAALRAAGRGGEADAEARRARELWEAKGATLLAERALHDRAREAGGAAVPAPRTEPAQRRRIRPNAATDNAARIDAAIAARDTEALADLESDGTRILDHTTGISFDREGALASWRPLTASQEPRCHHDPLATLGDSLGLFRVHMAASGSGGRRMEVGAYERNEVLVLEVDAQRRRCTGETWATTHLGDAVARLYERHAELLPDGPERVRAARAAHSQAALIAGFDDPARLEAALAPDFEAVDHRRLALWSARGAAHVDQLRSWRQVAGDVRYVNREILALEPNVLLTRVVNTGTDRLGGGDYERPFLSLSVTDEEGRLARLETFDADGEAEALARFDALVASAGPPLPSPRRVRENAATRSFERCEAALAGRDAEALAGLFDASLRVVHHPSGVDYGRREMLGTWRGAMRAARMEFRQEILASLGDTLAVDRHVTTVEGLTDAALAGFGLSEFHEISLLEVGNDGRWLRSEIFADGRLGDAIVRLYARHAALLPEGLVRDRAAARAGSVAALLGPPDLDAWCACLAPAVEFVDRRTLGFGTVHGLDAARVYLSSLFETSGRLAQRIDDVLALTPDAFLVRWTERGTAPDGGDFERVLLALWVLGPDGRFTHVEYFDAEREAEALARFDALTRGVAPGEQPLANAASRSNLRVSERWATRDWEGVVAALSPALRFEDRRRMLRSEAGYEGFVAQYRLLFDQPGSRWTEPLLATRGERLSLHRVLFEAEAPEGGGPLAFDEHLALTEVDAEGRQSAIVVFDLADEAAAHAELEARFAAGEGANHPGAAWLAGYARGFAARNFDAVTALFSPDLVSRHHGRVGWGALHGPAALLSTIHAQLTLAPDTRERFDHVRLFARGLLFASSRYGTREGGVFENAWIVVVELDGEGRARRVDVWDSEHAALARFEALRPDPLAIPPNQAERALERIARLRESGDVSALGTLASGDFVFDDRMRRSLVRGGVTEWLGALAFLTQESGARPEARLVATAGERLALHHVVWRDPSDRERFETACYRLAVLDAAGSLRALVLFDGDARAAAFAELFGRWVRQPDAPPAPLPEYMRSWCAHDAAGLDSVLAEDFVFDDHRRTGIGRADAGGLLASLRALWGLSADVRVDVLHVIEQRSHGMLSLIHWWGTHAEGGAFESVFLTVTHHEGGRMRAIELFEPDDVDAARACFEALRPGAQVAPTTSIRAR